MKYMLHKGVDIVSIIYDGSHCNSFCKLPMYRKSIGTRSTRGTKVDSSG